MICEIINPSDAYTLECEDFLVGAFAVCLVSPHYGLRSESNESPVIFGWIKWLGESGVNEDALGEFSQKNWEGIAVALESVQIGSRLPAAEYTEAVHDSRRSSMNDIGRKAWALAAHVRRCWDTAPETAKA